MFLFFSKLGLLFIIPANWIIAFLVWRLVTKSSVTRRRLNIALITLIIFFGNGFIYNKVAYAWQTKPPQFEDGKQYDAGIVLGGFVSFDKNGNGFFNAASDRLITICTLYKTGKIKKIVISAGSIESYKPKEADYTFKRIIALGIPATDVIIENRSRNTFENATFSKSKIDSARLAPPYLLVTSALHIPRAVKVFEKAGLKVIPYPCNFEVIDKRFDVADYFLPKLYIISGWSALIKEIVGLQVYKLFNKA